ncbi:MAG: hypothetical protein COT73_04815 [Bdellovibrio sp. CG10_big_fil_rev_8_21_14_0_10_47_8]|nr:MAG: hypothetical protein COT73_04815 [Bdellovibrio sp. CG10_big_fil_rev_8_21_14_0_10_47_8]
MQLHLWVSTTLILILSLVASPGWSQVDPSARLLLGDQKVNSSPRTSGLESGRYKVRKSEVTSRSTKSSSEIVQNTSGESDGMQIRLKKTQSKSLPTKKVSGHEDDSASFSAKSTTVVVPPTTTTTLNSKATKQKPESEMDRLLFSKPDKDPVSTAPSSPAAEKKSLSVNEVENSTPAENVSQDPPVLDQVKDIVSGNNQPAVDAYVEQIHPDDVRLNRIEVDISPGVISDNSKSGYSFRNYSTFSPKIGLGAKFWMTPFLGIHGSYTTSMGGDVAGDTSTNSHISAQHEWTELGVDIRRFFGMSRKSNSLEFGLYFSEYKFVVPGDDTSRVGLKSTGVGLRMKTRMPVAPSYAWVFGGKMIPRVQHTEESTGINLSSGSAGESSRVDLSLGGEFKMSRQSQVIWDLTFSFEKNQFNGEADLNDPETGAKPKGVGVQNVFTIFSLGYRWGQ